MRHHNKLSSSLRKVSRNKRNPGRHLCDRRGLRLSVGRGQYNCYAIALYHSLRRVDGVGARSQKISIIVGEYNFSAAEALAAHRAGRSREL
jgi:hypothetical protein